MKAQMYKLLPLLLAFFIGTTMTAWAQGIEVTGVVIDASTEEPLIGATVQVKNSNIAAATDIEGEFLLKGVAKDATIVASYVG